VANLRRNQRKISSLGKNKEKFNPKTVKLKWTNIEKKITKVSSSSNYYFLLSFKSAFRKKNIYKLKC
jgi:hypothetical protein